MSARIFARELFQLQGITIADEKLGDCGLMLYGASTQKSFSGGSGCGCAASVGFWPYIG